MVNIVKFIKRLTAKLPNDAIIVLGNGTACVAYYQWAKVKEGQRIILNSGTASMGYAIPAAIGAAIASGKRVTCITGDGSLQMNIQELQTIKHYDLPIDIYVLNNGGYRSIRRTQDKYFKGDYIGLDKESGVSFPDIQKIAKAYGVKIHEVMLDKNHPLKKEDLC